MTRITVTIDNKIYHISCDEEEKAYLSQLAKKLNEFIHQLRLDFGDLHHQHLAIMAAMLNLSEVDNLKKQLRETKQENAKLVTSIINSANTIKTITAKLEAS